jgi:E3 ubiquitin-protein ligase HUWE1
MRLWGRPRNGSAPPLETTTHPLLLDTNSSLNRGTSSQSRTSRRPQRAVIGGDAADILQTIEDLLGDAGAVQLIHHFMSHGVGVSEAIRVDVPARALLDLHRRLGNSFSTTVRTERPVRSAEARTEGREFEPLFTLQRWFEEVKILHGEFIEERSNSVINHVIVTLLPAAIEAAKRKKLIEEEELAKEKELRAKQEAESAEKKEAQESLRTDAEATQVEAARSDDVGITADRPDEPPHIQESINVVSDLDTEMADASASAVSDSAASNSTAQAAPADTEQAAVPSASDQNAQPTERITVSIHGAMVDITDTGIDPTFLEALPDDMREEVLNQHARDQRAARVERPPDSQISAEFLDALPPEIRAEIIQQERQEQARHDQMTGAAEIDPASFIASLDPQLREVVLLDQDDGFIQTLPSHMIAEAGAYRESSQARRQRDRSTSRSLPPRPVPRKIPSAHDAIQLLDKTGVAVFVRLLFFPQVLKKSLLFKLLLNLCENSKTRTELFNLLLSILQDGTGDLAAVDKSFSQMSVRSSKSLAQTPKATGKQKASPEYLGALQPPNLQHDAAPEVIAQRCLEALAYIVSFNELSSLFFLTEHELPAGLRRAASKKGKGKERQVPQTHYPIVLLLGLLDRQSLVKTPSIMEAVVGLLATVTKPLANMADSSVKESSSGSPSAPVIPAGSPSPETNVVSPTIPATSLSAGTQGQQTSEQPPSSPPTLQDATTISERTRTIAQQEAQPSGMYSSFRTHPNIYANKPLISSCQ